ncbi:MAG: response regulator, partial [Melioribacteraceae bacterium]|nr:response regulator [Melioribacteraceae bacterium]
MDSILIVDDDIKLCTTLSEDLNDLGYITNYVTSVEDALQFLSSSNVDLVLLDLIMP